MYTDSNVEKWDERMRSLLFQEFQTSVLSWPQLDGWWPKMKKKNTLMFFHNKHEIGGGKWSKCIEVMLELPHNSYRMGYITT